MNADKKSVRRRLGGAGRATAMRLDESTPGALTLTSRDRAPDPRWSQRRPFTAEGKLDTPAVGRCLVPLWARRCVRSEGFTPRTSGSEEMSFINGVNVYRE